MKLWSHGEVYGLIQKAGLDHYLVPDLTSRKKKKSVLESHPSCMNSLFKQMNLIPMH